MKKLFGVGPEVLGDGKVLFEWSPKGSFLAAAGCKVGVINAQIAVDTGADQLDDILAVGVQRKVNIFDRNGRLYDEVHFPPADFPNPDAKGCGCAQIQVWHVLISRLS